MAMIALIGVVASIVVGLAMSFVTEQPIGVMLQGMPVVERFLTLFEDGDSSHRLRLFAAALEMWLDSPSNVFFGGGLASYPLFIGQADEAGWYPHNFILESLAEGGMVAVLILCVPLLRFACSYFKCFVINLEGLFLRNFALYSCSSYMFMGGIESAWIPLFALSLHLFATKLVARELHVPQNMRPMCDGHFGPRDFVRRLRSL